MKIPDEIPMDQAGPILCAGSTMYDPLRHWGATSGKPMTIGIIGIGGLGSMGIKLSKALGHRVVAVSTSEAKREIAMERGADDFVVSSDPSSVAAAKEACDLILNTVSADHQVSNYMPILARNGTMVQLGLVTAPQIVDQIGLIRLRQSLAGSHIGGIKPTEECLELCAKHGILPEIQHITADQIDWAWE